MKIALFIVGLLLFIDAILIAVEVIKPDISAIGFTAYVSLGLIMWMQASKED